MNESLHLYINGSQALLRRQSGWPWRRNVEHISEFEWDVEQPITLRLTGLNETERRLLEPKRALHVYLGSALCRFMAIDLPLGLRDNVEALAAAKGLMLQKLGLQSGDWEFSLDRVVGNGKSVVCAARRSVIDRAKALAHEQGLQLASLRPFISAIWNALEEKTIGSGRTTGVLAVEYDAFTVFIERSGSLDSLSSLSHQRPDDLIEREIRRLSYAFDGDEQETVHLLLPAHLLAQGIGHSDKIARRTHFLRSGLYSDFRDLLFLQREGDAT